jgi:hypothetical protein
VVAPYARHPIESWRAPQMSTLFVSFRPKKVALNLMTPPPPPASKAQHLSSAPAESHWQLARDSSAAPVTGATCDVSPLVARVRDVQRRQSPRGTCRCTTSGCLTACWIFLICVLSVLSSCGASLWPGQGSRRRGSAGRRLQSCRSRRPRIHRGADVLCPLASSSAQGLPRLAPLWR